MPNLNYYGKLTTCCNHHTSYECGMACGTQVRWE